MTATQKRLKTLIAEAVIKYANGTKAENAKGIFGREMLEQQFQKFYDESLEYQASIISNPDGSMDQTIIAMAQANAAAKLHRYLESILTAKYGPEAAIIFNLSDFQPRNEKEIVDFPSLEKATEVFSALSSGSSFDSFLEKQSKGSNKKVVTEGTEE